jgi:hypothetical protein
MKNSNVNIFKFRVIVDTEQDVFRDIEIETSATFEKLNAAILDAFDFEAGEMASFYMSNESWEKGLEIPLMEMAGDAALSMKSTTLSEMVSKPSDKILYIYDFMRMWIFYVELMEVKKDMPSTIYPRVALVYGDAPSQDSKEMDLFGSEFSEEEFKEMHGDVNDDADDEGEDDMFDADEDYFDESEFNGSYGSYDDH